MNACSIEVFSATQNVMLDLLGETDKINGSTIPRIFNTLVRVLMVAVAVRAISLTFDGIKPPSPSLALA